jgi:LacI family transcriptional regulator
MPSLPQVYTRVTLKDVARRVGVSVNAASKVLNNTRSSGQVSDETRKRILEVAKELGYQPNSAARSLVRRRSDIIAMYFEVEHLDTAEPFTAALIEGAERGCRERNQSLLLYTRGNDKTADETCRKLLSGTADGIVVASWTNLDVVNRLISAGIPVVHYPTPSPDLPSILIDETSAAKQVIDHLHAKGHKRILYHHFPSIDNTRPDMYARFAEPLGIEVSIVRAKDGYGFLSQEEEQILARPVGERPSVVVCWNDEFAYRVIDYAYDHNIKVPDELAVVGFDGAHTFPTPRQPLTTVFVPWSDLARTAVGMLVDIRDGKSVARETLLPVNLQVGDTT